MLPQGAESPRGSARSTGSRLRRLEHLLERGRLPWWSTPLTRNRLGQELVELAAVHPGRVRGILALALGRSRLLRRLIYQFEDAALARVAPLLGPPGSEVLEPSLLALVGAWAEVPRLGEISRGRLRLELWRAAFYLLDSASGAPPGRSALARWTLLHLAAHLRLPAEDLAEDLDLALTAARARAKAPVGLLDDLLRGVRGSHGASAGTRESNEGGRRASRAPAPSPVTLSPKAAEAAPTRGRPGDPWRHEAERLHVDNAGLALLWPFFAGLFQTSGLLDGGSFVSSEAPGRAALLLEQLARGDQPGTEHNLTFNKLLCGLELEQPVDLCQELTAQERAACEALLGAAMSHWSALGKIDPGGLRHTFLLREGILEPSPTGWLVRVERRVEDALMRRLPWAISAFSLPWCSGLFQVEW